MCLPDVVLVGLVAVMDFTKKALKEFGSVLFYLQVLLEYF